MIQDVLKKIFGSRNERLLKQYGRSVRQINALEAEVSKLSDEALRAKTEELRKRVQDRIAAALPRPQETADGEDAAVESTAEPQPAATGAQKEESALDRARREALDEV